MNLITVLPARMSSCTFLVIVLIFVEISGEIFGEEHYENEKRFLFETTTSHFADTKLAAMEASVLELRSRVQKLEEENQISNTLAYRLNHEFNTVQSQLNATMYHQQLMKAELNNVILPEIEYSKKKIRLVDAFGNVNSVRGSVEVFHNNSWGTVCDDNFSSEEARVTCHMLGWKNPSSTVRGSAYYGQGPGPLLLDDLGCAGTEKALWNCSNRGWYQTDCSHSEDVGVDCYYWSYLSKKSMKRNKIRPWSVKFNCKAKYHIKRISKHNEIKCGKLICCTDRWKPNVLFGCDRYAKQVEYT